MHRASVRRSAPIALVACLTGCGSSSGDTQAEAGVDGAGANDAAADAKSATPDASDAASTGDASVTEDGAVPEGGAPGDASDGGQVTPFDAGPIDASNGHVLVLYPSSALDSGVNEWLRFAPTANAMPQSVATTLDAVSAGVDDYASISRDGQWLALVTTRFGCQSGGCLALSRVDGTSSGVVKSGTAAAQIVPAGRPAIASGGALVVYPAEGGPHTWDLYAISLSGGVWSTPLLLTSGMAGGTGQYAHDAELSYDGRTAVFECGPSQYQVDGADICVSKTDGSGTSVVVSHTAGPGATSQSYTHHPDYAPDGTIVFEADWVPTGGSTERIWRFAAPSTITLVSPPGVDDDNSPCVFPDGRVASLWLPNSIHELKVMNADGTNGTVIESTVDVIDTGQSCGW